MTLHTGNEDDDGRVKPELEVTTCKFWCLFCDLFINAFNVTEYTACHAWYMINEYELERKWTDVIAA
jgi:hypothetical protein